MSYNKNMVFHLCRHSELLKKVIGNKALFTGPPFLRHTNKPLRSSSTSSTSTTATAITGAGTSNSNSGSSSSSSSTCKTAAEATGDDDDDDDDDNDDNDDDDEADDEKGGAFRDVSIRMKVRQHVNPLGRKYQVPASLEPGWVGRSFENPLSPMIIDIGCAKGSWALDYCRKNPNMNVLGLEIRRPVVDLCLERKNRWKLNNVHFISANANIDLQTILSTLCRASVEGEGDGRSQPTPIEAVCLQFPDPHFKSRHKKRRVVNDNLVRCIAAHVQPGTKVFLQSDVQDLEEDMVGYFSVSEFFDAAEGYDAATLVTNAPVFNVQTEREIATANKCLPVYRMLFLRNEVPLPTKP